MRFFLLFFSGLVLTGTIACAPRASTDSPNSENVLASKPQTSTEPKDDPYPFDKQACYCAAVATRIGLESANLAKNLKEGFGTVDIFKDSPCKKISFTKNNLGLDLDGDSYLDFIQRECEVVKAVHDLVANFHNSSPSLMKEKNKVFPTQAEIIDFFSLRALSISDYEDYIEDGDTEGDIASILEELWNETLTAPNSFQRKVSAYDFCSFEDKNGTRNIRVRAAGAFGIDIQGRLKDVDYNIDLDSSGIFEGSFESEKTQITLYDNYIWYENNLTVDVTECASETSPTTPELSPDIRL